MRRTKKPVSQRRSVVKKKTGPKSGCTPQVIEMAERLYMLGLPNWKIAEFFDVHVDTISYWRRTKPDFKKAQDHGRMGINAKAVQILYDKAFGWSHDAVKFFKDTVTEKEYDDEGNIISEKSYGRIIKQPYVKQYPPDTKALIKILSTHYRESWGEAYKVEHKHQHLHAHHTQMNIHNVLEQAKDEFSLEELKTLEKLGLSIQPSQEVAVQ